VALLAQRLRAQDTTSTPRRPSNDSAPQAPAVQINGLLQVWYLDGHTVTNPHDTYRIRRADIKLSGVISSRVRWHISLDGAKVFNLNKTTTSSSADSSTLKDVSVDQRSRILQEASIAVNVLPDLRVDVGQQIIPLSYEGVTAASQIETIERTMFIAERTRGGGISDVRDIGAEGRGSLVNGFVDYQIGVFNEFGDSQNSTDQNDQKATIGRVAIHVPFLSALELGASGGTEGGSTQQRHERAGGEAQFRNNWLTLRSEVMGARDASVRRLGYYGLGAIRPRSDVELVGRWDYWDPDLHNETGPADAAEREIVGGASYFIESGATRLAANVVRSTFPSGKVPASTMLLLGLQVVW
jgi:hypothetical protein